VQNAEQARAQQLLANRVTPRGAWRFLRAHRANLAAHGGPLTITISVAAGSQHRTAVGPMTAKITSSRTCRQRRSVFAFCQITGAEPVICKQAS
jgi:hypothetical protein